MKKISLVSAVLAAVLAVPALASMAETPRQLLGTPAPEAKADRVVTITPDTKYVNVDGGQIIKFNVGERSFTWDFDSAPTVMAFDLKRVAPEGLLDHEVTAYVSANPLYIGSR